MCPSSGDLSRDAIVRRPGGRSARVGDAVLRATLELFAEGGWDAVRVENVAARAGVHKTTIYRRWPNRGALIAAALDATPFRTPGSQVPDTGSLRSDLLVMTRESEAALRERRTRAIIRALAESGGEPELAKAAQAFWSSRIELVAAAVARAVRRGELPRHADVELVATMLVGAIKIRAIDLGRPTSRAWYDQLVDAVVLSAGGTAGR